MSIQNKRDWIPYKRQGEIIEIVIRDGGGQKIGDFKCVNNKDYSRVIRMIEEKFGYSPDTDIKDESLKERSDEIDWLKKDWGW